MERVPCSWTGKFNIVKMPIFFNVIYIFKAIPIKIPMMVSAKLEKPILKFVWALKGPQIVKRVLKNKKAGGLIELLLNKYRVSVFQK